MLRKNVRVQTRTVVTETYESTLDEFQTALGLTEADTLYFKEADGSTKAVAISDLVGVSVTRVTESGKVVQPPDDPAPYVQQIVPTDDESLPF